MARRGTGKEDDVPAPDRAVETPDRGREQFRSADITLVEIAKLQADGEHLKSAMVDFRKDIREVRERIVALEVNVSHLPGKGFIVAVVLTALTLAAALIAVAPKLQQWVGTSTIPSF